ncbi:sodium-dependent glucose transporter 1C-like [Saccoglossus kowalevskii]
MINIFLQGITCSLMGPSLPDLQHQVGVEIDKISLVFTLGSLGYVFGCLIGGFCIDKYENQFILGVSLIGMAAFIFTIPWCNSLAALTVNCIILGIAEGILDAGGNVVCINLWANDSISYMQALHFSFALGATVAPLFCGPFLLPISMVSTTKDTNITTYSPATFVSVITADRMPGVFSTPPGVNVYVSMNNELMEGATNATITYQHFRGTENNTIFREDVDYDQNYIISTYDTMTTFQNQHLNYIDRIVNATVSTPREEYSSLLWIPYTIVAVYDIIVSMFFLLLFCAGPQKLIIHKTKTTQHTAVLNEDTNFRYILISLLVVFFFMYSGQESLFSGFIYTYALGSGMKFTTITASLLNSLFWGCFAASRGLAIFIAMVLSPNKMVIIDVIGLCMSATVFAVFGKSSLAAVWIGTALLGIFMASVFPSTISWAEQYIKVNGKATAMFFLSTSAASVTLAPILGKLIKSYDVFVLAYMILALSVAMFVVYIIMVVISKCHGKRYASMPECTGIEL